MSLRIPVTQGDYTIVYVVEAPHEVPIKYNLEHSTPATPKCPLQPLASWTGNYGEEVNGLANADNFAGVLAACARNWVYCTTSEIPVAKRTAMAAYVAARLAADPQDQLARYYR